MSTNVGMQAEAGIMWHTTHEHVHGSASTCMESCHVAHPSTACTAICLQQEESSTERRTAARERLQAAVRKTVEGHKTAAEVLQQQQPKGAAQPAEETKASAERLWHEADELIARAG